MSQALWIVIAALAAAVVGFAFGRQSAGKRASTELLARTERAEQQLKEETARAAARATAQEVRARKDVAAVQEEMLTRIERVQADQRAETEKLARHLTEAYDELDRLRLAASSKPPDTGQGFPATMPLGDL